MATKEIINTYKQNDPYTLIPMDRDLFYKGVKKGKYKDLLIEVVQIFVFKPNGLIALQKRAITKNHNAGMLDKSIGGHIKCGYTPKLTVMGETIEELGTAAYVAANVDEFGLMMKMLGEHVNTVSLAQHIDTVDVNPIKVIDGQKVKVGNRSHVYLAIYNGAIRFKDNEASGINYFTLEELKLKMESEPSIFTDDLHIYLDMYWDKLVQFREKWLKG